MTTNNRHENTAKEMIDILNEAKRIGLTVEIKENRDGGINVVVMCPYFPDEYTTVGSLEGLVRWLKMVVADYQIV